MSLSSKLTALAAFFIILVIPDTIKASVVINEITWMGTSASSSDEWIELYNTTNPSIKIDGWILKAKDGNPSIKLSGIILGNQYYLLERTDDNAVSNISADQIYTGAISNNGEDLQLYNNSGILIDEVNSTGKWFAGNNSTKQTMERKNPTVSGSLGENWQISQPPGGTPRAQNSIGEINIDTPKIKDKNALILKTDPIDDKKESTPRCPA